MNELCEPTRCRSSVRACHFYKILKHVQGCVWSNGEDVVRVKTPSLRFMEAVC
jgi:hypothetical protein